MIKPDNLPPLIVKILEDSVFNNAEFIGNYGEEAVYSFSLLDKKGFPMPTGLPHLVLIKGVEYRIIYGKESFEILDSLTK